MSNVIKFPSKKKSSHKVNEVGDRIQSIRSSLEKINILMAELKDKNKKRRDSD